MEVVENNFILPRFDIVESQITFRNSLRVKKQDFNDDDPIILIYFPELSSLLFTLLINIKMNIKTLD